MANPVDRDTVMVLSNEWEANFHEEVAKWDKRGLNDAGLSSDEELRNEVKKISLKEPTQKALDSDEVMKQDEENEGDDEDESSKRTPFEIRRDQNRAEHDMLFSGLLSTPLTSKSPRRQKIPRTHITGSRVSKRQSEQANNKKSEKSLAARLTEPPSGTTATITHFKWMRLTDNMERDVVYVKVLKEFRVIYHYHVKEYDERTTATMKKTLLLCFIHGFKGDDNTFGDFPNQLQTLVSNALPKINVRAIVYPKFETRGDLAECVSRFRDWLQEKVIDIEVTSHTPSPTIDPSVHVILIGHSMGGIVAVDTILALTSDQPIDATSTSSTVLPPNISTPLNTLMFPYIQGVLAFDTPYLGISPGVVAHGAEGHYNTASSALTQLSSITGAFWGTSAVASSATKPVEKKREPPKALPAPETPASPWAKWGKLALAAGGVAAVTGAGAAAFVNRDKITEGWGWVGSHLEFVGCLMKAEDLKRRVNGMVTLNKEINIGWANLYTRLGKQAVSKETGSMVGPIIGNRRTFCRLPVSEAKSFWKEAINDLARDEPGAHMTMFHPKDNPGYKDLCKAAQGLIVRWTKGEWYESSVEEPKTIEEAMSPG